MHILHERRGSIALVTLNRPQARNALTFNMYAKLAEFCTKANRDDTLRAIIITGSGEKAFASGTDISQFTAFTKAEDGENMEALNDAVFDRLERCRVPVIAAISGFCTGGGLLISACCDLRIATADAQFGMPIARTLGNCLSMGDLSRLVPLLGVARLKDLMFTARLMHAEEALTAGYVRSVHATHGELMDEAWSLAERMAEHAPLTLRATKEALRRMHTFPEAREAHDLIDMCYTSEDFHEGVDAFLHHRTPQWKGR
jgi:enoyl-CoA hydratase